VSRSPSPPGVSELLRAAAADDGDREAYVAAGRRVTYRELDRAADGFAATLLDAGVRAGHGDRPGDVVCLLLASSIEFAACYLGALRAGAVTSALNLRLGPDEQRSILARTRPAVTVLGPGVGAPPGVDPGRVLRHDDLPAAFAAGPPDRLPDPDPDRPACVVWTSGTTGAPKGAVYDERRMAAISANIGELTRPGDRRLVVLPFAHVGYMTRIWDEVANRTTIVLAAEPWSPRAHLDALVGERITMATGVPTQWELLLRLPDLDGARLTHLRVCGIGGAPIPPELVRRMRERLGCPVITRYTSTEAGVCTSTTSDDPPEVVATTVGRPAPQVELRVVTPGGAEASPGAVGEVWCRSPAMMRSYWDDPVRTAEAIDSDGWLHTGDLGALGPDGRLRIVGRTKEMYLRGGYNVYPAEVEAVLREHPAVAQVAVCGIPDPVLGEIGAAFVVPEPGAAPTLDGLRAFCRARLADYKAPDRLVVVDELPLTAMHKVDKAALARRARLR
jgi:acyl-CoA synthetase (AMP-forming)/AMP-acid ligase II